MASIINATTSTGLVQTADNSGSLQLQTNNGTTAVTIDTSQNVGIGTSSPSSFGKFAVSGQSSLGVDQTDYVNILGGGGTARVETVGGNTNINLAFSTKGTGATYFWRGGYGGTASMIIDGSGNVFVGGASQSAATGVVYSKSNAKAWVFFTQSGGSITVENSFNVSSVTRAGGGIYDVNFSTAMSSNAYACVGSCNAGGSSTLGTAPTYGDRQASATPTSTSSCRLISGQTASATCYDAFWNSVIVFGT